VNRLQVAVTWRRHWWQSKQSWLKLPMLWNWNTLFGMKTYIAGGRLVLYFHLTSFSDLSKCVEFCSEFFELFSNYFVATAIPCCQVQHVSDTVVFLTISLKVVCWFYTLKSWHLDFPCICTLYQLTLSAGQVGTRAEVRENAFPSCSLLIASNLCRSGWSPRAFLSVRAVTFNLTSTWKMWKL
jgi:hypothetical protein